MASYTVAQTEEMKRKNRIATAKQYDAHVVEYDRYDPMFLAMGITVPKAKRKRQLSPAHRAAAARSFSKMMDNHLQGQRTLQSILKEERIGRGWHGSAHTVRG